MPAAASLNYLRIAPRKVRLVADLIRGKSTQEAQRILNFTTKKAAQPLLKLLKSAVANAKEAMLEESGLYIKKITVDEGPKYKRWMPRARGSAYQIQKKTSHITLVLDVLDATGPVKTRKKAKTKKKVVEEKKIKTKKPKVKPEIEKPKPKLGKGIQRIFRRKSF